MKTIFRIIAIYGAIILMIILLLAFIVGGILERERKEFESYIGNEIVFIDDTLLIINGSFIRKRYILEDNSEISFKLAVKLSSTKKASK